MGMQIRTWATGRYRIRSRAVGQPPLSMSNVKLDDQIDCFVPLKLRTSICHLINFGCDLQLRKTVALRDEANSVGMFLSLYCLTTIELYIYLLQDLIFHSELNHLRLFCISFIFSVCIVGQGIIGSSGRCHVTYANKRCQRSIHSGD